MKRRKLHILPLAVMLLAGLGACLLANAEASQTPAYQVGDYVTFGTYPQTKSGTDNTPIEWLVLDNDGETALLISRYALDCQMYNTESKSVTWEQCTLRSWLNDEFYNRAFSEDEKQSLFESDVSADKNPTYSTNPGNATKDNVFLLSLTEAEKYFANDEARMCAATEYAAEQGVTTSESYIVDGREGCWWWLRSPGSRSDYAAYVYVGGTVDKPRGDDVSSDSNAVRPCVRVQLDDEKAQAKKRAYQNAEKLRENGQYAEAQAIYATIQGYRDADELSKECGYQLALEAEVRGAQSAQAAYDAFKALGSYKDSADRAAAYETKYKKALRQAEKDEFDAAIALFTELGTYSDSADRLKEAQNAKTYAEAVSKQKAGEYDAAITLFTGLGSYSDSAARLKEAQNAKAYAAAVSLMNSKNYEEAIKAFRALDGYGDSEAKIKACETALLEQAYQKAENLRKNKKYEEAIEAFRALNGYGDSAAKIKACETALSEQEYQKAENLRKNKKYEEAIEAFRALDGYGDSEAKIKACETALSEQEYQKAENLRKNKKYEEAIEAFRALNGYGDSEAKIKACETAISEQEYQKAETLRKNGKYAEAYAIYATIQGYKDVDEKIDTVVSALYKPGSYVTFGTYPQTKSGTDKTAIEWLILENDGETVLLISRYALDCQPYNTDREAVTWEQSTLRSWLNKEFYNRAFSTDEKQSIRKGSVSADKNPDYYTALGNATKDNVFLLSIVEAEKYFKSSDARTCAPTNYAIQQGAYADNYYKTDGRGDGWWWLRSPGQLSSYAAFIDTDGSVYNQGYPVDLNNVAVRPCVRVQLSKLLSKQQVSLTAEYQVGDYVTLGTYPKTTSGTDDTPIEWLVLENDGETALLISRYALDCRQYNTKREDTTWEQCTLRSWLNDEFYNRAFSTSEKQSILTSDVSADRNPGYSTNPGNATKDNVFLLSIVEANKYFTSDKARMCAPTDYAIQQGADTYSYYRVDGKGACWWWLRSPASLSSRAAYVNYGGSIGNFGYNVDYSNTAVRPCIRVRLS